MKRYDNDRNHNYDSKYKRQRYDNHKGRDGSDPLHEARKLKKIITRVGDDSSIIHLNLKAEAIVNALPDHQDTIIEYFCRSISELPSKTSAYVTLTGLLNSKTPDLIESLLISVQEKLLLAFEDMHLMKTKLYLRYLMMLHSVCVVKLEDIFQLLSAFTSILKELKKPQAYSDTICGWILSALPWSGMDLIESDENENNYKILMSDLEHYMNKRENTYQASLSAFLALDQDGHSSKRSDNKDGLIYLWEAIKEFEAVGWKGLGIVLPQTFDSEVHQKWKDMVRHRLESIEIPDYDPDIEYPSISSSFLLFDQSSGGESNINNKTSALSHINRFVISEMIRDLCDSFFPEAAEAGKRLASLPITIPRETLTVESILAAMFTLSKPPRIQVYYSILLITLCRTDKAVANYGPAVGQSFALLLNKARHLNITVLDRFTNHFSLHLSNFGWKWPWSRWGHVLDYPSDDPSRVVICDVLQRCEWLSYRGRIAEVTPDEFEPLLPVSTEIRNPYMRPTVETETEIEKTSSINNDVDGDLVSNPANMATTKTCSVTSMELKKIELFEGLQSKMTDCNKHCTAVIAWFQNEAPSTEEMDPSLPAALATAALLVTGGKTMSYLRSLMIAYLPLLQKFIRTHSDRLAVLSTLVDVHGSNPQMVAWVIGKLQAIGVLDTLSIVDWVFSSEMVPEFTRFYIWMVLDDTLERLQLFYTSTKSQLLKAQMESNNPNNNNNDDDDGVDYDDSAVKSLERKLEKFHSERQTSFSLLLERFSDVLMTHLSQFDGSKDPDSYKTPWFQATLSRLQALGRTHRGVLVELGESLRLLKLSDADMRIYPVFREIETLR